MVKQVHDGEVLVIHVLGDFIAIFMKVFRTLSLYKANLLTRK